MDRVKPSNPRRNAALIVCHVVRGGGQYNAAPIKKLTARRTEKLKVTSLKTKQDLKADAQS